jgi:hypothetical protein
MLRMTILMPGGDSLMLADGALVQFDGSYRFEVTYEDGHKMPQAGIGVGVKNQNTILAVDRRPIWKEKDTIFIHLSGLRNQTYVWEFDARNLRSPGRTAWLIDTYSGAKNRLNTEGITRISFTAGTEAASRDTSRFYIVLSQPKILPLSFIHTQAIRHEHSVQLEWSVRNETEKWSFEIERMNGEEAMSRIGLNTQPLAADGRYSTRSKYSRGRFDLSYQGHASGRHRSLFQTD